MATAPITDVDDPGPRGRVAAVLVNYRTPDLAIACLDALAAERSERPDLRVIVVDGGSGDDSAARIAAAMEARALGDWASLLALPVNGGFGYANNQALMTLAAEPAPPDYVLLINPDARVRPGALDGLARVLDVHPRAGAVGGALEEEDGTRQGCAFNFPSITSEFCRGARTDVLRVLLREPLPVVWSDTACRTPWVTGAAVMLRMAALRQTGLFDDSFFLYFEEVELMSRIARAGWEIWHEPAARVVHIGGASTTVRWDDPEQRALPRLPSYWYESRLRYFVRTRGALYGLASGLAFLAGRMIWQVRRVAQRRSDPYPSHTTRDVARHSLWARAATRRAARLPRLDDAPGATPAWMLARDGG